MPAQLIEPTPEISDAARSAVEHVSREAIFALFDSDEPGAAGLADLVAALAVRFLRDLAAGRTPVYASSGEEGVSPQNAANLLGVSRQFVDRLIAGGRLACEHKPGSTHRLVPLSEVARFLAEREQRAVGARRAVDALLAGGLDY